MYMIETGKLMKLWLVVVLCVTGLWLFMWPMTLCFVIWGYTDEVKTMVEIAEEEDKLAAVNYITEEVYDDFEPCLLDIEIRRANFLN